MVRALIVLLLFVIACGDHEPANHRELGDAVDVVDELELDPIDTTTITSTATSTTGR